MTIQVHIDGRPDGSKLTKQQLERLEKEEEHGAVLDDYLKGIDGTYGFMGSIADPMAGFTAPKQMLGGTSQAERVARVRARLAAKEPCKPLAYIEGYEVDLLSVEDQEAFEEGWICPNCIQYQAVPGPVCNWQFKGERPSDPKDWGCGYRRDF